MIAYLFFTYLEKLEILQNRLQEFLVFFIILDLIGLKFIRCPLFIRPSKNQSQLALVETAFLSSTACLLCLIGSYLPMGKAFLKPMLALPLVLVYLRWGKRACWMSVTVSSLLVLVLIGPISSLLFAIPHGLIGIQLGAFWRRSIGWGRSIFMGSLFDTLGVFFRFWLTSILMSEDLWAYAMNSASSILSWVLEQFGILVEPSVWIIQIAAIFLLFLSSLISLLMTHITALLLFERIGGQVPHPPAWLAKIIYE